MKNVLIIGANGGLAQTVIPVLLAEIDVHLRLFLRRANRLSHLQGERVGLFEGDALSEKDLLNALQDVDLVYANLSGSLENMAKTIVNAMKQAGVKRLIFVSSMGIYGETGEDHGAILEPYRKSAAVIEQSGLDYTILRPAWFTNSAEIDYALTQKGEAFRGSSVSKRSIADVVSKIVQQPNRHIGESLGIAKI